MSTIREWMNDKTILITGAAGFFGKVLIEKLLRTCQGVKRIYLIIRPKHGKSPQERWDEITKDPLFEKLLAQAPDIMEKKVTILDGDMSLINFGLSHETIEELQNAVNVIYHSAATVRFNDPLQKAFLSNTRGTLEMCKLASETNNLEVFVHVSTTFCNHNMKKAYYEEKVYEPCQDWRTILKLIEKENPVVMNTISYKIIEDHPNTYTFTKSLSEKIVEEYSSKFPTVIARPSVVVGTLKDPIPGWTDNLNGILGLSTAMCKGILRVLKGQGGCCLDYIPVDTAINALIVCSWEKANSDNVELSIYNCAYASSLPITFEKLMMEGMNMDQGSVVFDNDIWHPFLLFTTNDLYFHFLFYFLQVLPALIIDSILFLMKQERRMMKLTIKIYLALQALSAFTQKDIKFDNKKYHTLWDKLKPEEVGIYGLEPPSDFCWKETTKIMVRGIKLYILKENLENNEYQKKKLRRLYYLHNFVKGILYTAAFVLSYKLVNVAMYRFIL